MPIDTMPAPLPTLVTGALSSCLAKVGDKVEDVVIAAEKVCYK